MDKIYDCIIIGSGLSGLSFAHQLKKENQDILILEKNDFIGGQIHSTKHFNGFVSELGSHSCYNSYTSLLKIAKEADYESEIFQLEKIGMKLYHDNRIKSIFSQINFLSLFLHGPRIFFSDKKGKSVKEFYSRIVGKRNYDHLFSKMFRAVIVQKPDDYPAGFMMKKRKERSKGISYKFSFKNGLQSFLQRIIDVNRLEIALNAEVVKISGKGDVYETTTKEGVKYISKNIAIGVDPSKASELIKDIEEDVAEYLKSIPTFLSESHNVVIRKDATPLERMSFIISLSDRFMSVVTGDVRNHPKYRTFTFNFERGQYDEASRIKLICEVLQIKEEDILEQSFIQHILPSLRVKHTDIIPDIEKLRKQDSLFLLGNFFYGLALEDCVNRSLAEYERFNKKR
jgi:protoporphyrinogen oxidase